MERGDLAAAAGAQVRAGGVEDVADPLHPAGRARESSLQRGELAAEEAEEPAAEDVGVADRRPRQLVELLLLEAQLVDDAEQDAPIDLLLAAEPLLRLEVPAGIGQPVQASLRARIGQVRPAVVVLVVAGIGGVHRVVAEEVGEEGVLRLGKAHGAHGAMNDDGAPEGAAVMRGQ